MFGSPSPTRPVLTLDPWSADYGAALDFDEEGSDDEPTFEVDALIETGDWSAGVRPRTLEFPETVAFVDGVQRIEAWARVDDGGPIADAALASVASGAVVSSPGQANLSCEFVARVLALAGPTAAEALVVPHSRGNLVYEIVRSTQMGRRAAMQAIAVRRRELEAACVQKLLPLHPLVIADGRLDRPSSAPNQLVGVAKTLHQLYLAGEQRALISRLEAGTRTPLFLIKDTWGSRLSFFLRLPHTRPIHHSYAGIVRLEIPVDGPWPVSDVADMLSHNLPRFASRPEHDPRAPQNLMPVGALEKQLRHEMGDRRYIRRLIEDHLAEANLS